jgi:PAS domain S-box-containing protein
MPFVDFHLHSNFSDGDQTPEAIAGCLNAAGVRCAALTDHDTLESWQRFSEALKKHSLACLPGLELTTYLDGRELHLLAYGFDPQNPDMLATLLSLRQARNMEVHSVAGSLRKLGANIPNGTQNEPPVSSAPTGHLETAAAIALLHRAGGKVFWAHPLAYEPDLLSLDTLVDRLKSFGLDGLEAHYLPYSTEQCTSLTELAHKHSLLICAGTDYHSAGSAIGIEMSREDWLPFREALFSSPAFQDNPSDGGKPSSFGQPLRPSLGKTQHFKRRSYILRIFLPTLIAIGLFLAVIWGIILPVFEQALVERKRELIRELTNSAWSILASYEQDEQNGLLSRTGAQRLASARVEALRYGSEGKDYFWIQDLQPRMIMHPYLPDLNGQDLTTFTDPRGVPIFVEFASLVQREGEGYIDYVWQWKDDPERLEPKESYVRGFEPWGWVIGTGLYTDDVLAEIKRLERSLLNTSLSISGVVVLLLVFVLQQSLRIERERQEVLDILHESTERYHSLVEATTEGTLLIENGHCRYANPTFLEMAGYSPHQLEFLDLQDLYPPAENLTLWAQIEREGEEGEAFEGLLYTQSGAKLECVLALSPIHFAGQNGQILLCRDVTRQAALRGDEALSQTAPIGIFRAKAARRGILLEFNPLARAFFPPEGQPALADLFTDSTEYESFLHQLNTSDVATHLLHLETPDAATRFLALTARLVSDGDQSSFVCTLQDVTALRRQEAAREALIEKLQASLLFLHEPLTRLGRDALICDLNTPVAVLAHQMSERNVTAALVSNGDTILGIVTDHDLRARVLAENISSSTPIYMIMSSPLGKIPENALIYEALLRMEEKGVRHLAVEDRDGHIVSVIDNKSLIQFQRYGVIVLAREISRSASPAEVAHHVGRTPPMVKTLLDSSARPRHVTHMLASICDAATERLVELSIEELGEPPVPFAFIAMGSQGRQEQTLVTDQDNGIIFAPTTDPGVETYFRKLGQQVCEGLAQAGYTLCRGGVMASQPLWCRSLPNWISGFNEWIRKSEPQEIIDLSIFFDFRTVYGEADLTHELRGAIQTALTEEPACFHHLAQNALAFKPPFRLLGNIYLGGGATEHAGEINLKDAMMPMVSFARLYALRHQVNQTHTLERIEALTERGVILPSSRDEIVVAYDFLMQLRLKNQVAAIQEEHVPTNLIQPGKLGYIQQELLKQAFAQTAAVQKKVSYDFLGGV